MSLASRGSQVISLMERVEIPRIFENTLGILCAHEGHLYNMKHEKSCGVVAYIIINNEINYLLVKQTNGFLSFPKGHVENNETEEETALRECLEETSLKVNIKKGFRKVIHYYIPEIDVDKEVVLFIGEITNLNYHKQEKEITDIKVCKYLEAHNLLEFDNWKETLKAANDFLQENL